MITYLAMPTEEARWAYLGDSKAQFRFNEWVHHHVPIGTAKVAVRLARKQKAAKQLDRLGDVLGYLASSGAVRPVTRGQMSIAILTSPAWRGTNTPIGVTW